MKTRLLSATAAALLAAGAGLAQSPSLPPIGPIPQAPDALPTLNELPVTAPQQGDRPAVPKPAVPPIAQDPAVMPGPPVMPAPEQPCTACNDKFTDQHIGPKNCTWVQLQYGYLWFAPAKVPVLAQNTTTGAPLLGGPTQSFSAAPAGFVDFGIWLNERHTVGVYAGGMMSDIRTVENSVASDVLGNPAISRPFVNALTGINDTLLVSGGTGGTTASGAVASTVSARLDGINTGIVWNVNQCDNYSLNFTFGARYIDLDEQLSIYQSTHYLGVGPTYSGTHPAASVGPVSDLQITDRFRTRNQFLGMQFGLDGEWYFGPLFVGIAPKVAFGTNRQTTDVDGSTTFTGQQGTVTVPGGLYAVGTPGGPPGTEGIFGKDVVSRFAVLADVTGKVGIQLTANARITAGYNFLYLNNVSRPGLEIQSVINPRVIPVSQAFGSTSGPVAPQRAYDRTDYVAHGLNLGLEVRY